LEEAGESVKALGRLALQFPQLVEEGRRAIQILTDNAKVAK
jgi:hypothetical protein